MRTPEGTIKRQWITAGHGPLWSNEGGTYFAVDYSRLPPLPLSDSQFGWLSKLPPRDYASTLASDENRITGLSNLDRALNSFGFAFPDDFRMLISRADVQAYIPSCTDCYLELSESVISLPGYPGSYAVRFMNDSQACVLWYLLFQPTAPVRVLASWRFIEPDIFEGMQYEKDIDEPLSYQAVLDDACICAESFSEFIHRFCIENTIWFATHGKLPLAPCEEEYIRAASATKLEPATNALS